MTARARALRGARGLRAAAVRRPPGDRAMSAALPPRRACTYSYPGASAPALRDVDLEVAAGEFVVLAGGSGSGKSTLLRAASGLVPHFHGGEFGGRLEVGRPRHADARAGRDRGGRRHAVPGPGDAGRDGHRPRRARVPAREPRPRRAAPSRAGWRRRRSRSASRRCSTARRTSSRAASCSASRSAPRSSGARGSRCSTSRPRSSTPSRATSCSACCGGSTRSGGRR